MLNEQVEEKNDESTDKIPDTYQLFTKDLPKPKGKIKSRNASLVKNYTDDKAILADKVFYESFDEHFKKWKLGERQIVAEDI